MSSEDTSSSDSGDFDYTQVKVKQEKPSPPPQKEKDADEILGSILPNLFESPKSNEQQNDNENDVKKPVEPIKSSNEILAELFKVFNAAPPQTLLNDDYLVNSKKKKHKKEKKHKKKSKKHGKDSSDAIDSDGTVKHKDKHKHKKKHKADKRSSSKDKKTPTIKVEVKDSPESDGGLSQHSEKHKSKHKKKKRSKSKNPSHAVEHTVKRRKVSADKDEPKKTDESDFIISDEEEYIKVMPRPILDMTIVKKEKPDSYSSKESHSITIKNLKNSTILKDAEKKDIKREVKRDCSSELSLSEEEPERSDEDGGYYRRSFYSRRDRHSTRSRRYSSRDRYRGRWRRSRSRSRNRRRSRSRSGDLGIDKKRLLEIARKNAITMFKSGSLPGTQAMSKEIRDKVVLKMRYSGKTVEELTEFCKKLSKGESLNDLSSLSSNEDSDHDKEGNERVFHHPFVLKDRGPIVMNIRNATPIPPKSTEKTKAILQYPVSSGQQHRMIENEWVPVTKKREPLPPPVAPKPQLPKNVFEKPLPTEQQQPAFVPVNPPTSEDPQAPEAATIPEVPTTTTTTSIVPVAPPAIVAPSFNPPILPVPPPVITEDSLPSPPPVLGPPESSVFPQSSQNLDVSTIITQRLNAMRKLQENPTDPEALKMMYDSQKEMTAWATSKFTPGQFIGSTGANILTAKELTAGQQAWAKRDQLTNSAPVSGGIGMHLLQKMGWRPGEGLGKERKGSLQPLLLEIKFDKRGLHANEEDPNKPKLKRMPKKGPNNKMIEMQQQMEVKHPVSLLGEIAAKRKWSPPLYEVVIENGPSHQKTFIFRVSLNGALYQPTTPCGNKKQAKALAAKYCLQQLGILRT